MVAASLATSIRDAFADYLEAWAHGDFHERVAGKQVPVQVIVGAHDLALTADVMRATWLAWYPNAVLEVMPDAGHYPMDESPIALASVIERFLGS
jgi:pimeloyl-ACP methyl ester carboxylesterase